MNISNLKLRIFQTDRTKIEKKSFDIKKLLFCNILSKIKFDNIVDEIQRILEINA